MRWETKSTCFIDNTLKLTRYICDYSHTFRPKTCTDCDIFNRKIRSVRFQQKKSMDSEGKTHFSITFRTLFPL